jgi:RES domain-containing protein
LSLTAWRIVKARYAASAFRGEGARRFGGRWNSKGTPIVYTAGSQALAVLEMLVHLEAADLLSHYRLIPVTFDESLVKVLEPRSLPANWGRRPTPISARAIGDEWALSNASAVLRVPSVVVPSESNYLLNVMHPDFPRIKVGTPQAYRFDRRLK